MSGLRNAAATSIGLRSTMEDRHVMLSSWGKGRAFFAVYDGHGGDLAVRVCAEGLHLLALEEIEDGSTVQQGLEAAFHAVDECVKQMQADIDQGSGSTAVVAVVTDTEVIISHAGDSRAVVCNSHGSVVAASSDHKPNRPDEEQRVNAAGSVVFRIGVPRVAGVLAVSRSIGDGVPGVIATPEHVVHKRSPTDELMLLASDRKRTGGPGGGGVTSLTARL